MGIVPDGVDIHPAHASPGDRILVSDPIAVTLATAVKYRLPVPARMAHEYVNELRRAHDEVRPLPE